MLAQRVDDMRAVRVADQFGGTRAGCGGTRRAGKGRLWAALFGGGPCLAEIFAGPKRAIRRRGVQAAAVGREPGAQDGPADRAGEARIDAGSAQPPPAGFLGRARGEGREPAERAENRRATRQLSETVSHNARARLEPSFSSLARFAPPPAKERVATGPRDSGAGLAAERARHSQGAANAWRLGTRRHCGAPA